MTRTRARSLLALALALGVATDILFRGHALGLNVLLDLALLLVAGAVAAGPAGIRRVDRLDAWLAPVAITFAAFVALRADPTLVAVDVLGAVLLGGAALASLGGRVLMRADAGRIAVSAGEMALAAVIGAFAIAGALRPRPGGRTGRAAPAWAAPVLRGILVAAPLLLVFAALFAAADAVFAAAAGRVLALPFDVPIAELVERGAGVAMVAWVTGGVLVVAAGLWATVVPPAAPVSFQAPIVTAADDGSAQPDAASSTPSLDRPGRLRIGHLEALVVLVLLDVLFASFVALQVAYLFGGLDTLTTTGLTYAEYARRGFFELLAAAALAAVVVVTLDARVRRTSRRLVVAALGLLGMTGVTLVSSFLRLRLYQDAYGWTELRFWVLLSIGWLAVALVAVGGLVLLGRSGRVAHVLGALGVVVILVANVLGPQGFVAARNLERAIHPALVPPGGRVGLDEAYLSSLGDDAVPAMVAALPDLAEADRAAVRAHLEARRRELATDPTVSAWPAWNLAREQARAALEALKPTP